MDPAEDTIERLPAFTVYVKQTWNGPDLNQLYSIVSNNAKSFGEIIAIDWTIHELPDPSTMVVGHVRGTEVRAAMDGEEVWNGTRTIIFQDDRFGGSTLEVRGPDNRGVADVEWAIVGGTGQFKSAQGTIYVTKLRQYDHTIIYELLVDLFYRPYLQKPLLK